MPEPTLRCGLAGTKAKVEAMEGTVHRTAADIGPMIAAAGLPERVARTVPGRVQRRWPRSRDGCTPGHHRRCTSTRWGPSTASWTWSGPVPPSRYSGSTRCGPAAWPPARAWSSPPTA